ncbi:major facilitator superfamily domain-containing protein [Mycena olivaceomarginata]|nr:major facilitator superfamily domain-containing protein [Mycena olivaceomarginata]
MVTDTGAIRKTETNTTGTDAEKGSTSYAASTTGLDHKIESNKVERRLLFKLDIVILPLAVLLYLSAYLDRSNNRGLQATVLRGSDTNYSIALSCFYSASFSNLHSAIRPRHAPCKSDTPVHRHLIGALIWSIAATCQAATFSPAALYVSRLFVGAGESLFGQSMWLYLTYWYLPDELSKRIGLLISAGSVAGAFGGLNSYGRTLALTRLNTRHVGKGLGLGEGHTGVDWKAVKRALLDWKTYVVSVIYSCMNLCLGSVTGFLPTIVKGLGYSDANAQLFTVPPYVVALVFMLLMSTYSDARQTRGILVAIVFGIAIVGWSILLAVPAVAPTYSDLHARYFGCICIVTAGYANIPLIISWQTGNTASQSQRAASLGMLNAVGQCLSVLAAFLFPSGEGPKFVKGTSTNIAFSTLGLILTLFMAAYYRYENARRDKNELGIPEHMEGGDAEEVGKYDLARGKYSLYLLSFLRDELTGFRYTP